MLEVLLLQQERELRLQLLQEREHRLRLMQEWEHRLMLQPEGEFRLMLQQELEHKLLLEQEVEPRLLLQQDKEHKLLPRQVELRLLQDKVPHQQAHPLLKEKRKPLSRVLMELVHLLQEETHKLLRQLTLLMGMHNSNQQVLKHQLVFHHHIQRNLQRKKKITAKKKNLNQWLNQKVAVVTDCKVTVYYIGVY
jgi:hypothetical protein